MIGRIISEAYRTLRVATYHPVGWGLGRLQSALLRKTLSPLDIAREANAPVIFVHGIFHNATAFFSIENFLKRAGFAGLSSVELWTSLQSVDEMALQVKAQIRSVYEQHKRSNGYGKVRVVAHSLGGIILRVALLDPDISEMVDKVIFLGVPHQGSISWRSPYPRCLKDLHPASSVGKLLREVPLPGGIQYWNLRGSLDFITPLKETFLPHVPNLTFDDAGHVGLLTSRNVLDAVQAILETPLQKHEDHASLKD